MLKLFLFLALIPHANSAPLLVKALQADRLFVVGKIEKSIEEKTWIGDDYLRLQVRILKVLRGASDVDVVEVEGRPHAQYSRALQLREGREALFILPSKAKSLPKATIFIKGHFPAEDYIKIIELAKGERDPKKIEKLYFEYAEARIKEIEAECAKYKDDEVRGDRNCMGRLSRWRDRS